MPTLRTDTVVIGAGHAGLAMSHRLTERSIDHVLIERGEVANSWRTERWDSLRLLTPNWHARLPGGSGYDGDDPDGYLTMPEVIDLIAGYGKAISAPVCTGTTVESVRPADGGGDGAGGGGGDGGYEVVTDQGTWRCRAVVLASGACNLANVPAVAESVPAGIDQVTPLSYTRPDQLADGGVLVVGASATGVQLADEIHRSGRPVTLAVGEHVRMPRLYRGRDIFWWLESTGVLDESYADVDDIVRARNVPSPQLVGTPERSTLDLNALTDQGVRLVGRLAGINDGTAQFSGSLANVCSLADLKMNRLLTTFDEWAAEAPLDGEVDEPHRLETTRVDGSPPLTLRLASGEFATIVWATGYRADHSWLDVPVFDYKGRIRHDGGVVSDAPGLYLLGQNVLRRRRSSYIAGTADDTAELADHLKHHLDTLARP